MRVYVVLRGGMHEGIAAVYATRAAAEAAAEEFDRQSGHADAWIEEHELLTGTETA